MLSLTNTSDFPIKSHILRFFSSA